MWSSHPTGPALPSSDRARHLQVIHVTGRLRARALGLVALGHTLPPAPLAELPLHGHMIVFRLSLGLTILACESRYRGWGLTWEDGGARESGVGRKSEELAVGGWGRLGPWGAAGGGKAAEGELEEGVKAEARAGPGAGPLGWRRGCARFREAHALPSAELRPSLLLFLTASPASHLSSTLPHHAVGGN